MADLTQLELPNEETYDLRDPSKLPLAGGTMTGVLTLKGSMYEDAYNGALNANNSNIYNLNSIYTADSAGGASEGIHFYRDATHVDSLWVSGGDIMFVPNRELGVTTSKANSQKVGRFTANPTSGQVVITDGTTGGMKSSGYTIATSVPSGAKFTDTNYYHTTGSWSGLTYTATANGGAGALAFTIPTGTSATTVAVGNHTHTLSLATDEGTSELTLAHGGKYKLTAGGETFIFTMPASENTDTKVRQSLRATQDEKRPLLMSYFQNTVTTANVDNVSYRNNDLYYHISGQTLYAPKFVGDVSGCTGLTKSQVTTALGYTPPTTDTDHTYSLTSTNDSLEIATGTSGDNTIWDVSVVKINGHTVNKDVPSDAVFTDTDTKVKVSNTNPTSGTWYYPVWYTGTSGTGGVNANDGFRYYSLQGTADTVGESYLSIGNATASGTAGNKIGHIRIYGKNTRYAQIDAPEAASANRIHTLPGTAGTILNTGTTSFTQSLSNGTKIGTIKINNTSTDIYCETNTDVNVTQTETTSGHYNILMSNNNSGDTTTYTAGVRKSNKLYFSVTNGELGITNGDIVTEGYTSISRHIGSDPSYFISRSPNGAKLDLVKNNSSGGVDKQLTATEEDIELIGTGNNWDGTNTSLKSALSDKADNSRIIAQPWVDVTSTSAGFVDVPLPSGVTVVSGSLSHAPAITPYYRAATYGYGVTCYALASNKLRVYMYNGVNNTALPANTAVALSILWYKG